MHSEALVALKKRLHTLVKHTEVEGQWPTDQSIRKNIDALSNLLLKEKKDWLNEIDVYSIYLQHLVRAINTPPNSSATRVVALTAVLSESAQQKLIEELTDYYLSIPRKYKSTIQLPSISIPITRLDAYGGIAVIADELKGPVQNQNALRGLLGIIDVPKLGNKARLEFEVEGYAGFGVETSAAQNSITIFKITMQQLLSAGLLTKRVGLIAGAMSALSIRDSYQVPKHHIHFTDLNANGLTTPPAELSINLCQFIDSYQFLPPSKKQKDLEQRFLKVLRLVARLLESKLEGTNRLRAACQWRFDAHISTSPAISLIQTSIGLESLFGEDDQNAGALTRMLADRCAYLVSRTIGDRKKIREKFTKFYQARSKVVHGNAVNLSAMDLELLHWGQSILDLAIQQELLHALPKEVFDNCD